MTLVEGEDDCSLAAAADELSLELEALVDDAGVVVTTVVVVGGGLVVPVEGGGM